jgi:hypothetical protein
MLNTTYQIEINSFILIESLKPSEATSTFIKEFIEGNYHFIAHNFHLQQHLINSEADFKKLIINLVNYAKGGMRPLLNIDCHGGKNVGLAFLDGSTMSWDEVAECLRPLNEATNFNLMTIFSCCFGAHFMGGMGVVKPAPSAFVLGPTHEIYGSEVIGGLISFYSNFLETLNLMDAVRQARRGQLVSGDWYAEFAVSWYAGVTKGYLDAFCTRAESRERVAEVFQLHKSDGNSMRHGKTSMSGIKKDLARLNRVELVGKYFDVYFMLDKLPDNKDRFEPFRQCTRSHIDDLQKTGKYLL